MSEQMLTLTQAPVIEQKLQAFHDQVIARTEAAKTLACTEETVKAVKQARAELRKDFDALEEQRKAIKSAIMEPYNRIEALYKTLVAEPFNEADNALKERISEVEGGVKAEREAEVRAYFDELRAAAGLDWLTWEHAGIKVTLTTKVSALKKAAKQFVDDVSREVKCIQQSEDAAEVMVEYKDCMDVAEAFTRVTDRHRAIEEQQQQAEAFKAAQEQRENTATATMGAVAAQEAHESIQEPQAVMLDPEAPAPAEESQERLLTAYFSATGTIEQLKALKTFMNERGIQYGTIQPK